MENLQQFRLSVSKTKTFLSCKKQYHFNYILKLPTKEFTFHTLGKLVHRVLELFHNTYLNGSQLPYNEVMTISWKTALSEFR